MQLLAFSYLQSGRPQHAATLLTALDALVPGQRKVMRMLALAQHNAGDHAAALDTLERVALGGNTEAAFHLLRARALFGCGRRIEAHAAMATCQVLRTQGTTTGAGS